MTQFSSVRAVAEAMGLGDLWRSLKRRRYGARVEDVELYDSETARMVIADQVAERYIRGHEPELTNWLVHTVRSGDLVIDAGAHHGYFTLLLAELVGPTGYVIAIEPDPGNLDLLEQNLHLNGLQPRVLTLDRALGRNLELDRLPRFDVAKIDIEGDELDALQTGPRALRHARAVHVEVHPPGLPDHGPGLVLQALAEAGLEPRRLQEEGGPNAYPIIAKRRGPW